MITFEYLVMPDSLQKTQPGWAWRRGFNGRNTCGKIGSDGTGTNLSVRNRPSSEPRKRAKNSEAKMFEPHIAQSGGSDLFVLLNPVKISSPKYSRWAVVEESFVGGTEGGKPV